MSNDTAAALVRNVTLPSYRLEALGGVLATLAKKAAKLGVAAPTYKVVREYTIDRSETDAPKLVAYSDVEIAYATIVAAGGWRFLASVETCDAVDGVNRNRVSGPRLPQEIAAAYVTAEQVCEHCGHKRQRSQTYIVANAAGERKQVGSTCLRDFLGVDPGAVVAGLQYDAEIVAIGEDEERWGCGSSAPSFYGVQAIAAIAVSLIARSGFVTRDQAEYGQGTTTGTGIGNFLFPTRSPEVCKWKAEVAPTPEHEAAAAAIIARLSARILPDYRANPQALDNFAFKLGIILNRGGGDHKDFQLFAAAINREGEKIAREALKATATPIQDAFLPGAAIGTKVDVVARIETVKGIQTAFGESTLVKFITVDGYPLTTFYSGTSQTFTPGSKVKVRGTVKRLEAGRFGKETLLTRVKVAPAEVTG